METKKVILATARIAFAVIAAVLVLGSAVYLSFEVPLLLGAEDDATRQFLLFSLLRNVFWIVVGVVVFWLAVRRAPRRH